MSIQLTAPQRQFLRAEAKRLDISIADIVRRIIDQHRGAADVEAFSQTVVRGGVHTIYGIEPMPGETDQELADRVQDAKATLPKAGDAVTISGFSEIGIPDGPVVISGPRRSDK